MKNKLLIPVSILLIPCAAQADDSALKLGIAGHFKMYGNYAKQDEAPDTDVRSVDILRDVDIGFFGETTLDNGLTVGAVINADGDLGDDFTVEDSFVYLSGEYGRFSFGLEDSANFQLQIAAPAADENVDGLETFINPVNFTGTTLAGSNFEASASELGLDYDNDATSGFDKITYITPVLTGFQAGISYTPSLDDASRGDNGNALEDMDDAYENGVDIGARFEHEFQTWKLAIGAGYTGIELQAQGPGSNLDDFHEWNAGANIGIGAYTIGAVYTENNGGSELDADQKTFVLGADYTVDDQWRLGASWLNRRVEENGAGTTDGDRYTGGVVYNLAPGIDFRGSVSYYDIDTPATVGDDVNATTVTLGTQILF